MERVLRDVINSNGEGSEKSVILKQFTRRSAKVQATSVPAAAATAAPPIAEGCPATPSSSPSTPPDSPLSGASSAEKWTPGSSGGAEEGRGDSSGEDDDDSPAAGGAAAAAASTAWHPSRSRRSSLLPGAALPGGTAWLKQDPGTRLVQGWRGRGLTKAKKAALEEYLQQMAAHFAEVDAFELAEEDEDAAPTPLPAPPSTRATLGRAATESFGDIRLEAAAAVGALQGTPAITLRPPASCLQGGSTRCASRELLAATPNEASMGQVPGAHGPKGSRDNGGCGGGRGGTDSGRKGAVASTPEDPGASAAADSTAAKQRSARPRRATQAAPETASARAALPDGSTAAGAGIGMSGPLFAATPPAIAASPPASDASSDAPGGSCISTPASWHGEPVPAVPGPVLAPAEAPMRAADGRRSSVAHGRLRRQTLLPAVAAAVRPSDAPPPGVSAGAAARLMSRQRLSSLSLLAPPPDATGARGRASAPLAAAASRKSSLVMGAPQLHGQGAAAGRRSGSLARSSGSLAAARLSSGRESLASGVPMARRSGAGGPGHGAGASPPRLGAPPGAVFEEEEEEEAAWRDGEESTEQLGRRLEALLRVDEEAEEEGEDGVGSDEVGRGDQEEGAGDEGARDDRDEAAAAERTPLQQLLAVCGQRQDEGDVPSMDELLGGLLDLRRTTKIGEGTYGEVFRGPLALAFLEELEDEEAAAAAAAGGRQPPQPPPHSVVVKIIPMEGPLPVNGAPQKGAGELMAEAVIALALSGLRAAGGEGGERMQSVTPAFVRTCRAGVCRGRYPKVLVKAWKAWDKMHGSENDPVDGLAPDQLFCVLAMEEAGRDLEAYRLSEFGQARSVLLQVTLALAVGEEALGFEHRDLHWGNVLLRAAPSLTAACRLRGMDISVKTHGVLATLIDFTASRLQTPGGDVAFCDLSADPELFQGPKGNCQADTYRRMLKATRGDWAAPCPATNTLWLHYLADTILTAKAPQGGGSWGAAEKRALRDFRRRAAGYGSCQEAMWDELFEGLWVAQEAPASA